MLRLRVCQVLAFLSLPVLLSGQAAIVPRVGVGGSADVDSVVGLMPTNFERVTGAGTTSTVTSTSFTTVAGSLLVAVGCTFGNTIGAAPFSDSKSNTWSIAIASHGTTRGWCAMGYVPGLPNAGASHTVTFTATAPDFQVMAVLEVPGVATTSPLNQTDKDTVSSTTHTTGPISSGAAPEIHIAVGALSASAEGVPQISTANFFRASRVAASATTEGIAFGFRVVPASTETTFTYTTSSAGFETALIAGFKAAE